ncbi:MAG TPA: shikimate kinase [Terriglobia bacterium]|nr:shikimate kinase [Terriglobia bacterium]
MGEFLKMSRHRRKLIYLLGFMGSGKSTVGALLARELGWPFIDLDTTIETAQGRTIREIFEKEGETPFRVIEHAVLTETSKAEPAVIALGGGTFVQRANLDFIRSTDGVTIWLDCALPELRRRCAGMNNRPLFRDEASFAQLLVERLPFYQLAEHRVSTEGRTPAEVVEQLLRLEIF